MECLKLEDFQKLNITLMKIENKNTLNNNLISII